jgi:myo-inositol-1-phosphate synthase
MSSSVLSTAPLIVNSPLVQYSDESIRSEYSYKSSMVNDNGQITIQQQDITFKTDRKVPKLGMMLVGWGGNNGSTITAGCIANKYSLQWNTKEGSVKSNFFGSVTQSSTIRIGLNSLGQNVFIPFHHILPMVSPHDITIGGWDISSMNLADAMKRSQVLDYNLQLKLQEHMKHLIPLPGIYKEDFIALNQSSRADNVLLGT